MDNKHAMVKVGEYEVPLIGIPKDATLEQCQGCKLYFNFTQIIFDEGGIPYCLRCYYW